MPKFKIDIDERISMWQSVRVIVEAESKEAIAEGKFTVEEYTGDVSPYYETEDHIDWDRNTVSIIGEVNA